MCLLFKYEVFKIIEMMFTKFEELKFIKVYYHLPKKKKFTSIKKKLLLKVVYLQ